MFSCDGDLCNDEDPRDDIPTTTEVATTDGD